MPKIWSPCQWVINNLVSLHGLSFAFLNCLCVPSPQSIRIFSESTHNIALILEDDVTLEFSQYWDKRITEIIDNAPNDWEIIMLSYTVMGHDLIQLYTSNKHGNICCASAYLINKKGAQRLIKNIYKENKYNLENNKLHTADNYIFASMNTYTYKFSYFTHPDNNDSTIHPSHIRFHNQSKKYAKNIWTNKN